MWNLSLLILDTMPHTEIEKDAVWTEKRARETDSVDKLICSNIAIHYGSDRLNSLWCCTKQKQLSGNPQSLRLKNELSYQVKIFSHFSPKS
jgi:hypothetical protein